MATKNKTIRKSKGNKANATLLGGKSRFNLPTLIALVGVLSVVGYFVLSTFAAGPTRLASANCQNPTPGNTTAYDCYQGTAEGWSTKLYHVVLNRNPDPSGYSYWSNQINTKGVATSANSFIGAAGAKTVFSGTNNDSKVETLYQTTLGRSADPSGKTYWVSQFASKSSGEVIVAFLSVSAVKSYNNAVLRDKVLNYMKPGWNTVTQPPACTTCGCPGQPACPVENPSEPVDNTPTTDNPGPDYSFVIPDSGSSSLDGGTDALPSIGEVSLDDLSNASAEEIDKIIEEKTSSGSGDVESEGVSKSYGGKLKILPPEDAMAEGANEVRYYINAKLKATVKKSPYAFNLDTTRLKNAQYILTIVPYQNGEKGQEYSYVLSVKNNLTFWQKIYNVITAPFGG